jgi:hypothetical protein
MTIPMEVYLYNANGYSDTETFTLTIGQAALTDPLGQDAYGYYIYDDGDVDYTDHPTYQWVGIAPAEGGSGTLLTMTDSSVDGTEGDTDNADAVETFTLPFTFRFYGVDYTQMTVCSNGYIAMGTTLNGDFRNGRLPGVNGPNPMIAPFWDDLVIQTGGGVYRYYDAANHRLIIEWYNLKNGDNTSMSETFQAIFYDPSYYPTSTMDGAIKIQYQTFNNVDAGSSSTHGNYATIGIKNHTGMVGLEYSFNNQYPTAAKPITNGTAIYITTKPIIPNTPMLTIGQTLIFDPNDNGFVEPGETINLGIRLGNAGSGAASNVSATLSESDPYITLTQAVSNYGTITGLGSGLNTAYFTLSVAANCPADYIATLQLTITATGGYSWVRNLSIQVHKPTVVLESWMVDDIATNANNTIDPGETCYLVMNLKNEEAVAIENLNVTLSSNNASLVLATPTLTISEIAGTKRQQIVTSVTAGAGMTIGTTVIITLNVTSANGAPYATTITTVIGLNNTSYNFETTNGGFTAVNSITPGWDWGTSTYAGAHGGTKIWGCVLSGQYGNSATYELISPAVTVGSSSTLTFWHRWAFENSYDGGRLFASTDNGVNWTAITPTGGYPNTPSVFGGAGYGNSNTTWTQATFSLSAFASQSVKIKWQMMTDGSVVNYGWFIDDVAISNSNGFGAVGIVNGTVSLSAHSENMTSVKVAANDLIVTPAVSGAYRLRLPAGTYIITGSCDSYSTATGNASVTNNGTVNGVNLSLEYLSSVLQLTWMVQDNQINLRWTSDGRPTLQHYNVYRKAGADTWVQIAETNQTTYTENLTQQTWFDYRVTAQYTTGESVPSEIISLVYPNNNTDIAPASPASVTITKTATQITVAWQPVTTDVNGNPITPWGYKVYASSTPDFVPSPLNYLGMSTNSSWTDTITPGSSKLFYKVLATIGYLN